MADGFTKMKPGPGILSLDLPVRTVRRHQVLIAEDPATVFLVGSGSAEVFTSQVENGFPVGRRHFLFRGRARDAVFSLPVGHKPDTRLVMMASDELTILEIPIDRMEEAFGSEGVPITDAVEGWVNSVTAFLSRGGIPAAAEEISCGREIALDAGQHVYPGRNNFAWIRVTGGAALLNGLPEMKLEAADVCFPLGTSMWLRAAGPLRLEGLGTPEVAAKQGVIPGLSLLHALLVKQLASLEAGDDERELRRLEQRGVLQQRLTESALQTVVSVLDPQTTLPIRENSLLTAAATVGAALGIEIRPPLRSENLDRVKDPVEAIARASRVRHRRVLLRGRWWKSDCGPLIAYQKDTHSPVALLNEGGAGYQIMDPETRRSIPVNDETAQVLEPEAVMLYPSLPDEVKKPWQLLRFALRGRSADAMFIVGISLIMTLTSMLIPISLAMVMDKAIPDSDRRLLTELGLALIASSIGAGIFGFSRGLVTIRAAIALDATAESALWDKLLKLRPSFFKRYSSGDLLSRLMAVTEINRTLNGAMLQSVLSSTMALLSLILLFYFSSKLAMIAVGMGLATAAVTFISGYIVRRYSAVEVELGGAIFGLVVQMANAVGKIRVAGAEQRAFSLWLKKYSEQLTLVRKSQTVQDYMTVFNQMVPAVSTVLLFWVGVDLLPGTQPAGLTEGAIGVGVFLAFNTALATFISGTTSLSNTVVDVMDTLTKGRRIAPILEAENEISRLKADPGPLEGSLGLAHVEFRYAPDGPKILDNLSIHVNPGEFVALAGPSGSGKSTILRLLLGFETPESGTVLFDGQDLAGLDVSAVRRQLGVVLQSGYLTAGSLLENIAGGALIGIDEAWAAAADAALADDIRQMPMGMHTVISEGATNLSGGQRQRLLIARALVTRPRILLLDEATSALDNKTQAIVSDSLRRRRVTRLVIAHRLSTIKAADQIYVLNQGRIVERGTFEELANLNGLFASMVARQTV